MEGPVTGDGVVRQVTSARKESAVAAAIEPRKRSTARGEATRARLLKAAAEAFASQSFHGTSTRDIADAAGFSQAAMYVHYTTKEDLLFQICVDGHTEVSAVVQTAAEQPDSVNARLRAWVYEFVAWHVRSPSRARVIHYEVEALSAANTAVVNRIRRELGSQLRRLLSDGVEAGRFRVADTYLAAAAIMSMGIDAARWYRDSEAWSAEEVAERYSNLVLRMVGYDEPRWSGPRP